MITFARKRRSNRVQINCEALELAIASAVKGCHPRCEPFIGVFIERFAPKSPEDTNWAVKGIRFGKAERQNCSAALTVIIERLKQEFEISD